MKKSSVLSIALLVSLAIAPITSARAATPKSKCVRIGQVITVGVKKYTCVRSGKALAWKVVVPISTPTATPSPKPTTTPTPFKAKIPFALPVSQDGAITFANAAEKFALVSATAWQRTQDESAAGAAVDIPTSWVIGANTNASSTYLQSLLNRATRLFSGFQQPSSFIGLVFNAHDESWAEAEWPRISAKYALTERPADYIPALRNSCGFTNGVAIECYGGMALNFPGKDTFAAFYGVQDPFWAPASSERGPVSQVTHEFTHTVQFSQWLGTALPAGQVLSQATHKGIPCWFSEGQANGIGIPLVADTLEQYISARDNSARRSIRQDGAAKPSLSTSTLTASAIADFLFKQDIATCYDPGQNPDWQLGYNIGFAATEVLVAIGGPRSTMALTAKTAEGLTWADAFQAVYGISWKEGSTIIGKVLAAEYAAKPMDH